MKTIETSELVMVSGGTAWQFQDPGIVQVPQAPSKFKDPGIFQVPQAPSKWNGKTLIGA